MKFRKATKKDANGIAKVLVQSYNIKTAGEGKKVFLEETKKLHNYIVAEDNGKIAGIVTWAKHGLFKHQLIELDRIAVLPEYRGKGVARGLFNALVKDADKFYKKNSSRLRKLYLLCHADNKRAHKFYNKMGLKHESTLKQHYYRHVDEYVFSRFFDKK